MRRLGDVLGRLGAFLEESWGILEASWKRLEVFWRLLVASWRFLEASRSVVYLLNGWKLKNGIFFNEILMIFLVLGMHFRNGNHWKID